MSMSALTVPQAIALPVLTVADMCLCSDTNHVWQHDMGSEFVKPSPEALLITEGNNLHRAAEQGIHICPV